MDRRSSKPEVLTELRQRAVKLKKMGKTHRKIAEILEIGESTSRLYWARFKKQGDEGLKLGSRGRPKGSSRMLSKRQEQAIQKLITDKTPDQLKMPFALWTRSAIRQLVTRRVCSRTAESIEKPNEIKPEATRFDRLAVSGAIRRLCKMR